jgi:maltose alpha-D-glucosyltransferase/alpha-amylase
VDLLVRLAISRGRLGARKVNVRTQQRDPHSLLSWFDAMIATLRECPEIGVGVCPVLDGHRPAWR